MSRSYAREIVLKTIFQIDFRQEEKEEIYLDYLGQYELNELDYQYAKDTILGILYKKEALDDVISSYLVNWDIKRINKIELAILRLAAFEIIHKGQIPIAVSINEAINFTIKYSDKESIKYINAVLEQISKKERHS